MRKKLPTRVGSVLLSFTMLLSLLPVTAFAEETATAESVLSGLTESDSDRAAPAALISDEASLTQAVRSAPSSTETTITLAGTITLTSTLVIPADKNIVLDLHGYTLRVDTNIDVIDNNGTLTVKNGTVAGIEPTSSQASNSNSMAIDNLTGATLIVEEDEGYPTKLIGRSGIQDNGTSVTVYGGTVESYNRNAFWSAAGCSLIVYDGTFTSPSGSSGMGRAISANGDVTIYGGSFYAGGTSGGGDSYVNAIGMYGSGALVIDPQEGKTVTVTSKTDYAVATSSSIPVKIYGGAFSCQGDRNDLMHYTPGSIEIFGGSFAHKPNDEYLNSRVYAEQVGDRYVIKVLSDSTNISVSTYEELAAAMNGPSAEPRDIVITSNITIPSSSYLTLQKGYSLTVSSDAVLAVDGVLSLNDTLVNLGTLDVSAQGFIEYPLYVDNQGTITDYPTVVRGVCSISTPMQLQWLSHMVENGDTPSAIELAQDIVMPDVLFTAIGQSETIAYANSSFDGAGHQISGLHVDADTNDHGSLFGVTQNVKISDLTLSDGRVTSTSGYIGALVGLMEHGCIVSDVHIKNYTVSSPVSFGVGGFAGQIWTKDSTARFEFIGCSSENVQVSGHSNVGGVWGTSTGCTGAIGIYNCNFSGTVTALNVHGGICGGYAATAPVEVIGIDASSVVATVKGQPTTNLISYTETTNQLDKAGSEFQAVKDANGDWIAADDSAVIVAAIDGAPYISLSDAVSAAQDGDTIELLADVTLTEPLVIDENITIDGQNQYTITGHTKLQNGTLKDLTLTTTDTSLLTIGSGAETTIRMDDVTVKYPVSGTAAGTVSVLDGNNADIAISGCTFMNEADNGGVTEGASQWSYGLYMNDQGSSGSFTMTGSRFDGAFRTMLANINGTVTIEGNHFANSIFSNNSGSTSGSGEEATCITTGNAAVNNISITENTFDNAGAFYFQKTANVTVQDNTFNSEKFEHYIQVSGGAGQALDLTDNTFNMGDNDLVTVDVTAAPVLLPAGQKAVSYWAWSDTEAAIRPADYSSYVYAYDEDGNKVFYPASDAALGAFLNPVPGNIGLQGTDTMEIQQNLTLTSDAAIPDGAVLVIGNNATLVIAEGSTLTNNGTIVNPDRISGVVSSGETAVVKRTIRFQITPAAAQLVVKDLNGAVIAPEADHLYYLADGSYTYTVSAQGYYAQSKTFTVSGQAQTISVSLIQVPSDTGSSSVDSSDGEYFISVSKPTGGKVTVNPGWADKGDTVTITVTPNSGYELSEITVTDSKGNELKLFTKDGSKYTFTMPSSKVEIEVSFTASVQTPTTPFTDVNTSDYYYNAVLWAVENGVTSGTSATTFGPNVTVTRAQMMTFLWRAHGSPKATGTNPFTDVSSRDYYYDAVLWAVKSGITSGMSATTFGPDNAVTRAQAVTFQWRAAGSPAVSGVSFGDVSADAYYANAVAWAVAKSITGGTGNNQFSPDLAVSRAQAVTFLYQELG